MKEKKAQKVLEKKINVKPKPDNPLGIADFDMSNFELDEHEIINSPVSIRQKAEALRKELEDNSDVITKQLHDVRDMKRQVADEMIILKNYFNDLKKKEEVLLYTLAQIKHRKEDKKEERQ